MVVYVDAIRRPDIVYVAVDRGGGDVLGFEQSQDFPESRIGVSDLFAAITKRRGLVICYDETLAILDEIGLPSIGFLLAGPQPPMRPCGRTHISFYAKTRNIGRLRATFGILEVI